MSISLMIDHKHPLNVQAISSLTTIKIIIVTIKEIKIEPHPMQQKTICSGPIKTTTTTKEGFNPSQEKIKCTNPILTTLTLGMTQGSINQHQAQILEEYKLPHPSLNYETILTNSLDISKLQKLELTDSMSQTSRTLPDYCKTKCFKIRSGLDLSPIHTASNLPELSQFNVLRACQTNQLDRSQISISRLILSIAKWVKFSAINSEP